jgi:TolA-binding protein
MRQMPDEAIELLLQAEDIFGSNPRITNEIALLEMQKGNRLQALDRYLDMMVRSNTPYDQLKRIFDTYITDSADILALQEMLLQKIKQYPTVQGLSEWLKWTFVQLQDWEKAYLYTRSLDLRLKEDGFRMFELAFLCASNKELKTAVKCLDYIIQKGDQGYNYYESKSKWFEWTFELSELDHTSLPNNFESDIQRFIQENGPSNSTLNAAVIWAKQLVKTNQYDSANKVLLPYVNAPFLAKKTTAEAKIALADIQIEQGDMYQSELWLSQVEKDFKDDPLGQMAKFKRAELSFFRGDYDWANMQLDVLKGATTQLISNDALELSLCITDNLGIDSNYLALEWYSKAKLFQRQQRIDSALVYLDSVASNYPENSLADEVLYLKAQLMVEQKKYTEAANFLGILIDLYPEDILADNALFLLAQLQQYRLSQPENAIKTYEKLILEHTQSLFTSQARLEFRKLRGF